MTAPAHVSFSQNASPTNVTVSDENLCHYITDDQLRRLGEMRKDLVSEICLAAAGIFWGSLIPAIDGLRRFNSEVSRASGTDLVSMMLCGAALAAALITGYQWYVRNKGHTSLENEIRNRPKVPVKMVSTDG